MANITFINPNMIRISTPLTAQQIANTREVAPERLTVVVDKEVKFRIDVARQASVSTFGVCFTELNGALIATTEFDINKPTAKFIAAGIKQNLEVIEAQVQELDAQMAGIEIEII